MATPIMPATIAGKAAELRARDRAAQTATAVRALADFIEEHPELPVHFVSAYVQTALGGAPSAINVAEAMRPDTIENDQGRARFVRTFNGHRNDGSHISDQVNLIASLGEGLFTPRVHDGRIEWDLIPEIAAHIQSLPDAA